MKHFRGIADEVGDSIRTYVRGAFKKKLDVNEEELCALMLLYPAQMSAVIQDAPNLPVLDQTLKDLQASGLFTIVRDQGAKAIMERQLARLIAAAPCRQQHQCVGEGSHGVNLYADEFEESERCAPPYVGRRLNRGHVCRSSGSLAPIRIGRSVGWTSG